MFTVVDVVIYFRKFSCYLDLHTNVYVFISVKCILCYSDWCKSEVWITPFGM